MMESIKKIVVDYEFYRSLIENIIPLLLGWTATVFWWAYTSRKDKRSEIDGILCSISEVIDYDVSGLVVKFMNIDSDDASNDKIFELNGSGRYALQMLCDRKERLYKYYDMFIDIYSRNRVNKLKNHRCIKDKRFLELLEEEYYLYDTLVGHIVDLNDRDIENKENVIVRDLWCRGEKVKSTNDLVYLISKISKEIKSYVR